MSTFIQEVPLLHNGENQIIAELHKGFPKHLIECWKNNWNPMRKSYIEAGKWHYEHDHWNWVNKLSSAACSGLEDNFFWIVANNLTQGFMLTSTGTSYHIDEVNKENIDIKFLETAPWNYVQDKHYGHYSGVGSILLHAAIVYSQECGHEGRIGLDSLPQSEGFYTSQGLVHVEHELSPGRLKHFELTTTNAENVLKKLTQPIATHNSTLI